jgi:hypothetical protein
MAALDPISLMNSVHQEEVNRTSLSLMMHVGIPWSLHQLSTNRRAMRLDELALLPNLSGTSLTILEYLSVIVITASCLVYESGRPVTKSTEMVPNRRSGIGTGCMTPCFAFRPFLFCGQGMYLL